jgi:hypothetical protein
MADRSVFETSDRSGYRTMLTVLVAVVALMLVGYGYWRTGAGPGDGDPAAVLQAWRSFPADASPRPPVLTGPAVLDPRSGFPTDQDKESYEAGRFDLATALPATPATGGGYPVVSAKAAFERLQATHQNATVQGRPLPTLRIVTAALGQAYFDTDRGRRQLPAWRFGLERFASPIWVLAVQPTALWTAKPLSATDLGFRATPGPDGRTLRLDFIGGPDEPTVCGITYTASAVESSTAAVIRLVSKHQRRARGNQNCLPIGYSRTVTLRLAKPLGGRVLLTPFGVPLQVPAS